MPDYEQRRKRRLTFPCSECGGRIVWTKFDPNHDSEGDPFLAGHPLLPWRWQGRDAPIRYFEAEGQVFFGVVCPSCRKPAVYPAEQVPFIVARWFRESRRARRSA